MPAKASVKKFIYVSVFGHDRFGHLEYVRAHEDFVGKLQTSGLDYAVIRPPAYFSAFHERYQPSVNVRKTVVLGDGTKRSNPIHEAELAKVCVDEVSGQQKEIPVGGPKAHTRREIAALAFAALGENPRIMKFPLWLASILGAIMRSFDQRLSALFAFGVATSRVDCIAPAAGTRTLKDFYKELAVSSRGLP